MTTRDELKSLIDLLPDDRLDAVRNMLDFHINPPPPQPEIQRMQQRTQQYRKLVEARFRETRKPGTIGGSTGGGITGMHEGVAFGHYSFHYWDEKALVQQTLQSFDGQEIEIMQRFSIAPDRTKLFCNLELSSAGITVRHVDEFPVHHHTGE